MAIAFRIGGDFVLPTRSSGVTGTVELNGETQMKIYEDAIFTMQASTVAAQMSNVLDFNDKQDDSERRGGRYPALHVETVGEYDIYNNPQKFDVTNFASLTPVEKIAEVTLTDKRRRREGEMVYSNISLELGQAMARAVDDALLAGMEDFNKSLGSSSTLITWKHLAAARAKLRKAGYEGPLEACLHEYHAYDLGILVAPGTAVTNVVDSQQQQIAETGFLGNYMGIALFLSGRIAIANEDESNASAVSGVFARGALALDRRVDPILEPTRLANGRRWDLVMHTEFAAGAWDKDAGVSIEAKALTPDGS